MHDEFLVYPNEHITITKGKYNDFTFEIKGNKQRNDELLFFKTFHAIEKYPFIRYADNAPLDTILAWEKDLKSHIPAYAETAQETFDSLAKAYQVGNKFKKNTAGYLNNKYFCNLLFNLYAASQDTLKAHGLYQQKLKELLQYFNNITEKQKLNNLTIQLVTIADELLPKRIWRIETQNDFQSCFDTVQNIFSGLSRDYLLSHIMYTAYKKRIPVTSAYLKNYEASCADKPYKKLINTIIAQQGATDKKANRTSTNSLLLVNARNIKSLEQVLDSYKGKLVLIDFWASWCSPCREDIPYLKKIIQDYEKKEIAFISISLDREIQPWRKAVIAYDLEINSSYLLINSTKSSFVEQYGINSIPWYMLIGKDGKVLNADMPRTIDPQLKILIEKYLTQ